MNIGIVSTDALVTPPPRYGGLEQVTWALACGLTNRGHEVTLYALNGSRTPPGGRLVEFEYVTDLMQDKDVLLSHDLLHDHSWQLLSWWLAEKNPDRTFLHTWHGPSIGPHVNWSTPPSNWHVCGVSRWHGWALGSELGLALDSQVFGVPNGVRLQDYPLYDGPRDRYLLCVNRIGAEKGIDQAIALARMADMPIHLCGTEHLVSSQEYVRSILSRCDGRRVIFEGDCGLEVKRHLMQHATALLWTPTSHQEPFGLAMVEAMACGTPVIAFPRGAVYEVVGSGGWIIDGPEHFLGALADIESLTPQACRRNAEMFTVDAMVDRYAEVYAACVSSSQGRLGSERLG